MEARTKSQRTATPFLKAWNQAKDLDDSQKLRLIALLAESIKPAGANAKAADDEEYSLRPFTMDELNARIDQAEAEIAAGNVIDDEDVWRELEEEFAREDAEEDARQVTSYVEKEQFAAV